MKNKTLILIVDENIMFMETLMSRLKDAGYDVRMTSNSNEALARVGEKKPDIAVVELMMPGTDGIEFIKKAKALHPPIEVIITAAHASIRTAIAATKEGAFDYIEKPFTPERLEFIIDKAVKQRQAAEDRNRLDQESKDQQRPEEIVARSPRMKKITELIKVVASSQATVLITGESGTGKELTARTIHSLSPRNGQPFITVSCAALPENVLESELFGNEKVARQKGKIELAYGGTLFLDEPGEMSAGIQIRLLQILEGRKLTRAGSNETINADVRLISATNRDLQAAIKNGHFREDLYYRLNVVTIDLPPLRERTEDIPLLAEQFMKRSAAENQKSTTGFSKEMTDFLVKYPWPGNVRELENTIERAVILATGTEIQLTDILQRNSPLAGRMPTGRSLQEMEREHILSVLDETGGNQARAARILGITRATLYNKSKAYGLKIKNEKIRV